jgi:hypothetical protein
MSAEMRVLTVRQPWAWAIIHGGKDVENRVRNLAGDYRGLVAIHAGKSIDTRASMPRVALPDPLVLITGGIIGVVEMVDVHHADRCSTVVETWDKSLSFVVDTCSPWAELDVNHFVLKSPRALAHPIAFRGALGLRRLDATTIDLITKELP